MDYIFHSKITEVFGSDVTAVVREVTDDKSLPYAERKRYLNKTKLYYYYNYYYNYLFCIINCSCNF